MAVRTGQVSIRPLIESGVAFHAYYDAEHDLLAIAIFLV